MIPCSLKHSLLFRAQFAEVFIYGFHAAILGHELACTDLSYALDSGDIVSGITTKGKHIYHLNRL